MAAAVSGSTSAISAASSRLELVLGADLQLAGALAREAEVLAQLLERHRPLVHHPLLDDEALARDPAAIRAVRDPGVDEARLFLVRELVVLRRRGAGPRSPRGCCPPSSPIGRVEREVPPAHALLHLADLGGLHVQLLGDLVHVRRRRRPPCAELLQLAPGAGQAEEQLALRLRGPELHQATST